MKNKITIGLFVDTYYPTIDGVVTCVHQYATHLKDKANVFVACPKRRGHEDNLGYEVIRCAASKVPIIGYDYANPLGDTKFLNILKEKDIDIIHIHSPFNMGKLGVQIAKERKIPCVATMHSQYKYDFKKATNSDPITNMLLKTIMKTLNSVDELWAVNDNTEVLVKDYGYTGNSRVMLNATEMLPLDSSVKATINEQYNLKEDDKVLMFLGRMIEGKGIFFIAEVLKELKNRNFNFKMIFVGNGPDFDLLKNDIEDFDLKDDVILTGTLKDRNLIAKIYNRADLVIFPSTYDTDGIIKYEAASQATPTLLLEDTLAAGGIIDGENGFLSSLDVEAFANKIIHIFNTPNLLKTVSENVQQNLYRTWEERVNMAFERYKELIEIKNKKNERQRKRLQTIQNKGKEYERAKAITKAKRQLKQREKKEQQKASKIEKMRFTTAKKPKTSSKVSKTTKQGKDKTIK